MDNGFICGLIVSNVVASCKIYGLYIYETVHVE